MTQTHARWTRWALDALAVLVLLVLGVIQWLAPAGGGDLPAWATPHDLLLAGPDAGEWAINAMRLARGELERVDAHRMPAWLLVVGATSWVMPDIAEAGHLVNHLSFVALPLVLYGVGRADSGPATGLIAGLLGMGCVPLLKASAMYGVDPFVATVLPLTLLATLPVRERFWLAPLAGMVAGFAALSHFTALPYVLPAGLLILLRGPTPRWWHRLAGFGLYAVGVALVVLAAEAAVDLIDPADFLGAVSEGIEKSDSAGPRPTELTSSAKQTLEMGSGQAVEQALQTGVTSFWRPLPVPWGLLLVLPWLGAIGLGLGTAKGPGRWRFARWLDGSLGLVLVCCLAPLPVFAAAGAEPRYSTNLLPFVAILLARGVVAIPSLIELGLREKWAWLPRGVLGLPLAIWVGLHAWNNTWDQRQHPMPTEENARASRALGLALAEHFPGGGGAASPVREAAAYAGRDYCPQTGCPFGATTAWFEQCIKVMREECAGEGPIPYVVLENPPIGMGDSENELAMGRWAVERYEVLDVVESSTFTATLVSIPRE